MTTKPYIDQTTPRNPTRQHMTPEEAAGLIAIGLCGLIGALLGILVTWAVMR